MSPGFTIFLAGVLLAAGGGYLLIGSVALLAAGCVLIVLGLCID